MRTYNAFQAWSLNRKWQVMAVLNVEIRHRPILLCFDFEKVKLLCHALTEKMSCCDMLVRCWECDR